MRHFIGERLVTGVLIAVTVGLFAYSFAIPYPQTEWLELDYGLFAWHFQLIYGGALAGLLLAFMGEPRIRRELRENGGLPLAVVVAVAVGVFAMWQLNPSQPERFRRPVVALSMLLAWTAACGVGFVLLALERPREAADARVRGYAWVVCVLVLVAMTWAHVTSVGHFNRLDDVNDEAYLGSFVTNYVETGQFGSGIALTPYGPRDPFHSRYWLWMGMFANLYGRDDFWALRGYTMAVGGLAAAMMAVVLWRSARLSQLQRVFGLVFLLSLAVFVRTSHNIRMDIGLAVYGALVLWFLLEGLVYERKGAKIWLFLAGLSAYLVSEIVPTVGAAFVFGMGLFVMGTAVRRPLLRETQWGNILAYGLGGLIAVGLYIGVHFAPNFAEQWIRFEAARDTYAFTGPLRFGDPFSDLISQHLASFVMSPAEIFVIYAALAGLFWVGTRAERVLVVSVGVTQFIYYYVFGGAFGYQAVFVPIVVYAAARVLTRRVGTVVGVMVLLPIVAAAPLKDMVMETQLRLNERTIAELDLLTWRVPEGATVIGDDYFWLTLEDRSTFMAHYGMLFYQIGQGLPNNRAVVEDVAPDMVICIPGDGVLGELCDIAEDYFEAPPEEFNITGRSYLVFSR